ncbi:MAG: leucyl aminopeptidase [Roseiflexaceae bacterium]|nr:leucyl aminopeptidase [Roseiflexaceae bacterium]
MRIAVIGGEALQHATPLLVLFGSDGEQLPDSIRDLVEDGDWSGGYRKTLLIYPRTALSARRVLLVGIGKHEQLSTDRLREVAAVAAQQARDLKVDHFTIALPTLSEISAFGTAQALAEGAALGLYRFDEYKSDADAHTIAELEIIADAEAIDDAGKGALLGDIVARGAILARDLANQPGNVLVPSGLAEVAEQLGTRFGFDVLVLGLEELVDQGFGGIVGVGKGSANPPRFIVIEHGSQYKGHAPTVCLVGKGITFDSGGISIKPADSMELMKMDMGGAAAVLGTMQAVGELQLRLHVVGLIASAENMPSSTAYKPGDILKTLSGKTIEVINTDAEGRIVLADALFYAQRYKPDGIIDLATLTGAIMVALGSHAIGAISNNDAFARRILEAGEATGERAWQLPLWEPYREMVKSDIADVKNSSGRPGGAITAGAFLSNFVGDYPWVHLDIAGTAWTDAKPRAYTPKGATGVGVRLLIQLLRDWIA